METGMGPKKFTAANTTDALKAVRREIGGDALILSTRDTASGVEVIAISPATLQLLSQQGKSLTTEGALEPPANATVTQVSKGQAPAVAADHGERASPPLESKINPSMDQLWSELSDMKRMLQTHLSAQAWNQLQATSARQTQALQLMLNAGFSPELCSQLARELQEHDDVDAPVADVLQVLLESRVQSLDPMALFDQGGIFAFIGPTGVGKTTAIAKIAARCVLRYGREKLALLSTDTFRIGAQEQLNVYAKIIGVPVTSLRDGEDLVHKLKSMPERKVILLDTAGVSQRDIQMLEQSQLLQTGAPELKRILVMSSTTDLRTQEDVILMHQQASQAHTQRPIHAAIITKTDEAAQIGPVMDCLIRHQLPLIFLANGQRVPEDLSQANAPYLSHRALHPRRLGDAVEVLDEHVHLLMADQLSQWSMSPE